MFLFVLRPYSAQTKTLRVGIYQNSPKVFVDNNGTPKGIFVDIVNEIAGKENWKIDYVYGTWAENIRHLKNNEIDLLVDVSYSAERAEQFILSTTPVLESWLDIYSKRGVGIGSIRDLNMKKIAVLGGSIQEKYLREKIKIAFNIDFTLLPYPDYPSSVKAVKSGAADVMVASRFFKFSPLRDKDIKPAHVIFRPENLYFAFPKNGNIDLVMIIDRQIASMRNNPGSVYYKSLQRWLQIQPRVLIPGYIKYSLAIITGLLIMIGLFAFFLRQQVASKTIALQKTHRLLKETQSIAGLGGWEYDVHTRRIKWTDEMYRIYGVDRNYDPNDVSRNISFYAPQHAPVIEKALRCALEAGEPYDLELELIRAGGERIWVRTMSRPVMENGKVVRVTGNIMNITESKRAEAEKQKLRDQLVMAQKMELVGRLAGGVAHDFNNMLNVILGYADMAMDKVNPAQPLHADLKEIYNAATRSAGITRQLLAFARKQTIAPKVLDLNEALEGMLKMLRRLIGENIDLVWLPGAGLRMVKMDPAQIDQILVNLCVNARDAISGVGKVTIETNSVTFDDISSKDHLGLFPGAYVMLAVSDDGCGMDRESCAKIFEPFFTTKELGKGTGLGLATVYGIVKQNNGFIYVESEPGNGTTFKIYLPCHEDGGKSSRIEEVTQAPQGDGKTILLVEDEVMILNLGRRMLEALGYQVLVANSPTEAFRLAEMHTGMIDLLVTDIVMPEMNGHDLAARIETIRPGLKTLYMSGYTANVIAYQGVLRHGIQFLQKPFSKKELAAKVSAAITQKKNG